MKHLYKIALTCACMLVCALAFQSCLKDTCTRRFTMMTPVYKTSAEVRANIKNGPSTAIKNPGKMFVLGNYIFLNEVDKGVHIIDNADPANPVNKYFISIPGNIDLAVTGNTLYADLYSDLVTLDISNPASVVVKKIIDDAFPFRRYTNGFVADTNKIIVDWTKKDTVVQCDGNWVGPRNVWFAETAAFSSASMAKGISGSMARFCLYSHFLYTVTNSDLNVFDITNTQQPSFTGKVPVGWNIETIYPFKDNLFIGSQSGMFIYGTSNPAQPNKLSMFSHARVCDPVIADDNYAYVTLRSGNACAGFTNQLDVLDISNLSSPQLVKSYSLSNPHGLSKSGDLLFICDGDAGLKVFNAGNVNDIKPIKTINGISTYDVITYNNIAMVVCKDGLYQYRFTAAGDVTYLSKLSIQPS